MQWVFCKERGCYEDVWRGMFLEGEEAVEGDISSGSILVLLVGFLEGQRAVICVMN